MKYIIRWESTLTGARGQGKPVDLEVAKVYIEKMNREWPDLVHWYEEVNNG